MGQTKEHFEDLQDKIAVTEPYAKLHYSDLNQYALVAYVVCSNTVYLIR